MDILIKKIKNYIEKNMNIIQPKPKNQKKLLLNIEKKYQTKTEINLEQFFTTPIGSFFKKVEGIYHIVDLSFLENYNVEPEYAKYGGVLYIKNDEILYIKYNNKYIKNDPCDNTYQYYDFVYKVFLSSLWLVITKLADYEIPDGLTSLKSNDYKKFVNLSKYECIHSINGCSIFGNEIFEWHNDIKNLYKLLKRKNDDKKYIVKTIWKLIFEKELTKINYYLPKTPSDPKMNIEPVPAFPTYHLKTKENSDLKIDKIINVYDYEWSKTFRDNFIN